MQNQEFEGDPAARAVVPDEWKPQTVNDGFVKDWDKVRDPAAAPWRYAPSDARLAELRQASKRNKMARIEMLMVRKHVTQERRMKLMRRLHLADELIIEQPARQLSCTHKELMAGLHQWRPRRRR